MKKRVLAILCAAVMLLGVVCMSGCGTESDWAAIEESGKLVIGITIYDPMNYYDENNELIGFDTEFAYAVCEKLGVEADFQIIDWKMKETELKSYNIDCIWNGLTVNDERRLDMDFTQSYLTNKQVVVIDSADAATYTDAASLSGAIISAEGGSAGETAIAADENLSKATYSASATQTDALLALVAGNADAIVIDYTLAIASCGTGSYADIVILENVEL
ncbi:MAG: transporter substrate-binding domain-containing protein, partial [Clostridia bacterium]|nr:transporter substrate-binding domain-containing protein [Clostridia bacterium]